MLSACIFLLLLQKSRSASPHVEGCCCTILAIKRIPLLSCAAVEPCTSVYTAQRQVFLTKNLLLHGTSNIHVASELTSLSMLGRKFAVQTHCSDRRSVVHRRIEFFSRKNSKQPNVHGCIFGCDAIRGGSEMPFL